VRPATTVRAEAKRPPSWDLRPSRPGRPASATSARTRIFLGPAWRRDCGIGPGDEVIVALQPEGPQRDDLAPDIAAALEAEPDAAAFFDSLAQFYRRGYLRWIDATKLRPEVRPERIAETIRLLKDGHK
jgi:hypothetical protein